MARNFDCQVAQFQVLIDCELASSLNERIREQVQELWIAKEMS